MNAVTMCPRLFAVATCVTVFGTLCSARQADARWSTEITSQAASGGYLPLCASGYSQGTTPGKPAGGWYEWRFDSLWEHEQFFSLNTPNTDITRFCPRTYNELT